MTYLSIYVFEKWMRVWILDKRAKKCRNLLMGLGASPRCGLDKGESRGLSSCLHGDYIQNNALSP